MSLVRKRLVQAATNLVALQEYARGSQTLCRVYGRYGRGLSPTQKFGLLGAIQACETKDSDRFATLLPLIQQ
jgi:hypothetical protein